MPHPPLAVQRRTLLVMLGGWFAAAPAVAQDRAAGAGRFPDIVAVKVRAAAPDVFDFDVTVSSPYDTPARYADGFRVTSPAGDALYGERKLWHDHQHEQPFTRDLYGVRIPKHVKEVVVQGRDQRSGYGGRTVRVPLPGR